MRINMPINYGFFAGASSLNTTAKKVFSELGILMNKSKSFTVTATLLDDAGVGDVNQHYDCVHVPNMGGYKFPPPSVLHSDNLIIGIVGIDEVILGKESYRTEDLWKRNQPIIKQELKKWEKSIYKIKAIHVNTKSEKEQMNEYLKIPLDKMQIVPLGVDHDTFFPPKNKELTRKETLAKLLIKNTPYFLHISEVNWARKNIFRLFDAFKKAKAQGIPHKLIVVGKNEPIVYEKAREIPDVYVIGYVKEPDLVKLIQGADAFLFPSLHEGWGMPMVESMACQVPVLASNVYSIPEVLQDGGLLVDPYDVNDITEKIIELAKNENLRIDLGKNGLMRSNDFSWKKTTQMIFDLYEKNTPTQSDKSFEDDYESAALRTIITLSRIKPEIFSKLEKDILNFKTSRLIGWLLYNGFDDTELKDYLEPFRPWLESNFRRYD